MVSVSALLLSVMSASLIDNGPIQLDTAEYGCIKSAPVAQPVNGKEFYRRRAVGSPRSIVLAQSGQAASHVDSKLNELDAEKSIKPVEPDKNQSDGMKSSATPVEGQTDLINVVRPRKPVQ